MKSQHILITGSTRGIGFGLASFFASRGKHVTINGTTDQSVNHALEQLKSIHHYPLVQGFSGSVSQKSEMEILLEKAVAVFGPVHIWINNAGIDQSRINAWELKEEEISKILSVNIQGVINGSTVAFSHMLKHGGGLIYNMEGFGSNGMMMPGMSLYGTSKRAVRYFSESLAREARGSGVWIGTLSPGMVITNMIINQVANDGPQSDRTRRVFNILGDRVETVTPFLAQKILKTPGNGHRIEWLTKGKIYWRFLSALFHRRNII